MRFFAFLTAAIVVSCASSVQADVFFGGTTTGAPTWNRPATLAALSGIGSATPYFVQPFYTTSNQSGVVFEINGISHPDTYAFIYSGNFDPNNPLINLVDGDDDFGGAFTVLAGTGQGFASSRIAAGEGTNYSGGAGISLSANTQYYAVVTGFGNGDFGTFNAGIGGVDLFLGTVAIPEPSTALALGLASVVGMLYRRRRG